MPLSKLGSCSLSFEASSASLESNTLTSSLQDGASRRVSSVLSSTKNSSGERDPELHQTKKGNQWHFGMKAHIGVDADSGLVHTVIGTAANVSDVIQEHGLLHGEKNVVFAAAGYQGATKRPDATGGDWHVAMRPGKRQALDKQTKLGALLDKAGKLKASVRAKVEHPVRVIKCQFGFTKVRYLGLNKNIQQLTTLLAMTNL